MRVVVKVRTHKIGSECINEIDIDADTSQKDLEEIAFDTALEMIDYDYEVIE